MVCEAPPRSPGPRTAVKPLSPPGPSHVARLSHARHAGVTDRDDTAPHRESGAMPMTYVELVSLLVLYMAWALLVVRLILRDETLGGVDD